jgi:hypothetical protein
MKAQRLPHVRRVHLPPETAQEPAWRLAVGLVGMLLTVFAFFWLLPATQVAP